MEIFNKSLMYTTEKKTHVIEKIVQALLKRFIYLIAPPFFVLDAKNN